MRFLSLLCCCCLLTSCIGSYIVHKEENPKEFGQLNTVPDRPQFTSPNVYSEEEKLLKEQHQQQMLKKKILRKEEAPLEKIVVKWSTVKSITPF